MKAYALSVELVKFTMSKSIQYWLNLSARTFYLSGVDEFVNLIPLCTLEPIVVKGERHAMA